MSAEPTDQRRFTRITFAAETEIDLCGQLWSVQLLDLSLNGLLTDHPADFRADPGALYRIRIHLNDHSTLIEMDAHFIHSDTQRLGFQCVDIDLDSLSHLKRLLELNLGDPALIERELGQLFETHLPAKRKKTQRRQPHNQQQPAVSG